MYVYIRTILITGLFVCVCVGGGGEEKGVLLIQVVMDYYSWAFCV